MVKSSAYSFAGNYLFMHLNVTIKNVSWPDINWATLYILPLHSYRLSLQWMYGVV